jgi:PilZ domain
MSDNLEPRVTVDLTVRIWGMDADGRPFFQNVHAQNISEHGAKLSGIEHPLKAGDVIGVQVGEKKARCKVIWVINPGQLQKIQAGVQMLDGQPCPWQHEVAQGDKPRPTLAQAIEAPSDAPPGEQGKRHFERHRVAFPIEIGTEQGNTHMRTQATDIGGRGCYVETRLPLAIGTALIITFWLDTEKVVTPAIVRTSDGGVGMGIEFTGMDKGTQERLQHQLEAMDGGSDSENNVQVVR